MFDHGQIEHNFPFGRSKVILDDVMWSRSTFFLWAVFKSVTLSVDRRTYSITLVTLI